jgi:hypothetical protein
VTLEYRTLRPGLVRGLWTGSCGSRMFRKDTLFREHEQCQERTALKRASSRANGTRFGRPRKVDDPEHIATAKRMKVDGHIGRGIAKYLGVSRATLYRYLDDDAAA